MAQTCRLKRVFFAACHTEFFAASRSWIAILFAANTEKVHCVVRIFFSSSAIVASHSCGLCHADCLAFSFLGGSIEALTRSVSLYSTCSFSLPLCARQHSPPPTGLPECRLLKDKPSLPLSLFNSLSLSFSQFFHCLAVSLSLCLSIYQSQLLSQLLRSHVSERWKRCLAEKKNLQLCFILHLTGCCSCLWLSASAAASHKTFSPLYTNTITCKYTPNWNIIGNNRSRTIIYIYCIILCQA